jgi:serine/threonine protein kinase
MKADLKNLTFLEIAREQLQTEIKIHKSLFHKHVVRFEDVFEDKENVYIIMELCSNQVICLELPCP